MKVSEAGNTLIPAYLTLQDKGYDVEKVLAEPQDSITLWRATKDGNEFNASNPLSLLGIVAMAEQRGEDWQPDTSEAQEFMEKYLSE